MSPLRANRIPAISASLLPEETVAGRNARRALIWVVVMVVVVAGLCAAWFALAYRDKQAAEHELDAATVTVSDLQREQRTYSKTVQVQNEIATLDGQLKTVMANDLDWSALLDTVRSTGTPSGIRVDGVNGQLNGADGGGAAVSNPLPATNGATTIGALTVTGTGPDKQAVAAYVDALAKLTVVANPYVTNVATDEKTGVTFSLTVDITQNALCGRFTVACKPAGGK
ncbi:hypothetical protein GCM10020358_64410 [Amorphoplanes nipponensis]|uniref:Uncharacterized protein n=1 Tax=Actinoplanes nipponensis TaxID=135950 RepID=A0A919JJH8_9ACTN|nr:hypothetical protein Ani05nite_56880 [Actinoplanes nipponensis]